MQGSNVHEWALQLLNYSAFIYLAASILFIWSMARAKDQSGQNFSGKLASYIVLVGLICHTVGLALRWYEGGLDRPPWTNLYESLIFFGWGVVGAVSWALFKWKLPLVGAVGMPFIFVIMGMAVMTPNKSLEPLIPALQSYWLKIHVVFGMISYAAFSGGAFLAFLHLLKNGVSLNRIGLGVALAAVFNFGVAGGHELFQTGHFFMAKTVVRTMEDGKVVRSKDTYREYEGGPIVTRMEKVPHAHIPLWLSMASLLISALFFGYAIRKEDKSLSGKDALDLAEAQKLGKEVDKLGFKFFILGIVATLGFFGVILWAKQHSETLSLASNPYLVLLVVLSFFFMILFAISKLRHSAILSSLPTPERLEELSYKNNLFGFPFQTLLLITGAVWAFSAWGRSWGWDPKETWALITWFVYLIYLHAKLLLNWKPNVLSFIALLGFVVMIFAFLGVNLVLSGLHSYGSA